MIAYSHLLCTNASTHVMLSTGLQEGTIIAEFNKDAPLDGRCYCISFSALSFNIFLPACLIGMLHFVLFLIHISQFMTCIVNGNYFGMDILTVFKLSVTGELSVVLVPLACCPISSDWLSRIGAYSICVISLVFAILATACCWP